MKGLFNLRLTIISYYTKKEFTVKQFKIVFVRCLLLFYLSSSYLSATHIHTDALKSNSDCKVCIVVKNLNSGDVPTVLVDNLTCAYCYEPIAFKLENRKRILLKGFNANAPPRS